MNPRDILTAQIKKIILDHLTSKGWPNNFSDDQVIGELKPLWIKIEEAGLVQPGMSFQAFHQIAQIKRQEAQMGNVFGGNFEDIIRQFMGR